MDVFFDILKSFFQVIVNNITLTFSMFRYVFNGIEYITDVMGRLPTYFFAPVTTLIGICIILFVLNRG